MVKSTPMNAVGSWGVCPRPVCPPRTKRHSPRNSKRPNRRLPSSGKSAPHKWRSSFTSCQSWQLGPTRTPNVRTSKVCPQCWDYAPTILRVSIKASAFPPLRNSTSGDDVVLTRVDAHVRPCFSTNRAIAQLRENPSPENRTRRARRSAFFATKT